MLSNNKFIPVELPDYSFYTINLAKFFEVELNLSIGQLIRLNDHIEMPEYFNRLKPDGSLHNYLPNNLGITDALHPIPLNKPKYRKYWQPPGIGETKLVWESMLKKGYSKDINKFRKIYENTFFLAWSQIHRIRNKTAHTGAVTKEDKLEIIKAIEDLYNSGSIDDLISCKMAMKGIEDDANKEIDLLF